MLQLCDCHSHIQTAHPHPPQTATLRPPFRSRAVHTGYNIYGWEDGCQEKACTGSGSRLRTIWTRNSRTIAFQQWPGSGGLDLKWCLPQFCSILFVQEGTARGRPGQGPLLPGPRRALQLEGSCKSRSEGWQGCDQRNEKERAVEKITQGRFPAS